MTVYVDKASSYELGVLEASVRRAFSELKLEFPKKPDAKIVLKPNIVGEFTPDSAAVTSPALVEAVVNVLRDNNMRDISVCEGPGVGQDSERAFRMSGYSELCKRIGVRLVDLNSTERVEVNWGFGKIKLPKIILESDYYINMPKLKTHGQTMVTLALKNQKGLLLQEDKKRFHMEYGLHKPVIELAKVVSPNLNIVDGIVGMEGEGPLRGGKVKSGVIVYGKSMLEVDAACAMLMGFNPNNIEHIDYGIKEGLGSLDFKVLGHGIQECRRNFKNANPEYGHVMNIYSWRNAYACSMCIQSFSDAIGCAVKNPKYWLTKVPKLAYYALLGRLHIVQGRNASLPQMSGRVICFGNCTRKLAEDQGIVWIPGCPPKPKDILDSI